MSKAIFDPGRVTTDREFQPGQRMTDVSGEEYMFVQAGAAVTANRVVVIDKDYQAAHISAARGGVGDRVGVAKNAIANDSYGWVSIYGKGNIMASAGCAAGTQLYTSTQAGQLDDGTGGGAERVDRIALTTARGGAAGLSPAIWTYPTM